MNNKVIYRVILIAIAFFIIPVIAMSQASPAQTPSKKTAKKWIKSGVWNGTKLKPSASINTTEFYRQFHANSTLWEKVFAFLRDPNLDTLAPGKYPIDGDNAYATITEGPTKEFDKTAWESHRKYIDLQYVIKGREKIWVCPLSMAVVSKPYDESKDLANYTFNGGEAYVAVPGTFYLFFPENVHRPGNKGEGDDTAKKLGIKIRVAQ
ncbi:hypothetical protein BH09BAC6_BH09BAC6_24560 [soil metagenome]